MAADADDDVDVRIRRRRQSPERLHDDMASADIAHSLEYLNFIDGVALVSVERGVRDYLLRLVRRR